MILELIFVIENFIFKLGCSNSEKKALKWEVNSRLILTYWRVRETRHFPAVVESKATAGKPDWYARHDVTGSDLYYLPPYYRLAVPYLKVPNNIFTARDEDMIF